MRRHAGWALLACIAATLPSLAHAQSHTFDYRVERRFTGTSGAYAGWADELVASGHYDVTLSPTPGDAEIHGAYQWRYSSPEGLQTGTEDRRVRVAGRRYVDGIDLDEYDGQDVTTLATWVFVPRGLAVGDTVDILESSFRVVGAPATVVVGGAERAAIHLRAEGDGERHDAYGDFETHWTDEYWFDATTGLFLREVRSETDTGTTEGQAASLGVHEDVSIVGASYAAAVGSAPPDPLLQRPRAAPRASLAMYALPLAGFGAGAVFVVLVLLLRPRPRITRMRGQVIETARLDRASRIPDTSGLSPTFGAFLPHFVAIARRTDDAVWTATLSGTLAGLAIDDATTGIASIFAPEPDVCEALRRSLDRDDFFSEVLHGNLTTVVDATAITGDKLPSGRAYNLIETYEVLSLASPGSPTYDDTVVDRLEEADRAAASQLLSRVLGVPSDTFLAAALEAGDFGYVARAEGRIVGVGLATVVGARGRLHTLAIDPAHRNRGLGRELVRARIRAMSALGATSIVVEVATTNAASLELVRGEGFVKIGDMYVESARQQAPVGRPRPVRR